MNKKTKIILGISIIFAVILVALLILLAIVKGKNISVKPPIETEESESGEVEININRDNLDEFGKIYYDNIYECAYLTIDCTFSGDCFLDDDYFAKAYSNSNKENIQFTGYITPEGAEIVYADVPSISKGGSVYFVEEGAYINLSHLEEAYLSINGKEFRGFGSYDNYLLKLGDESYTGFDVKTTILEAILNSDYTLGKADENWAVSINGGFNSSVNNCLGNYLNNKFNEDMIISIYTEGEIGARKTTLMCDAKSYSFKIVFTECPYYSSKSLFNTFTIFEENEMNAFISEIRTVFGESAYEYLD